MSSIGDQFRTMLAQMASAREKRRTDAKERSRRLENAMQDAHSARKGAERTRLSQYQDFRKRTQTSQQNLKIRLSELLLGTHHVLMRYQMERRVRAGQLGRMFRECRGRRLGEMARMRRKFHGSRCAFQAELAGLRAAWQEQVGSVAVPEAVAPPPRRESRSSSRGQPSSAPRSEPAPVPKSEPPPVAKSEPPPVAKRDSTFPKRDAPPASVPPPQPMASGPGGDEKGSPTGKKGGDK